MKKIISVMMSPLSNFNPRQRQHVIYYGCIGLGVVLVFVVIWNLAFAGSSVGSFHGAGPTEKVITGASRLNPQDAWNERMTNQFEIQEKEIEELKKTITKLNEKLTFQKANMDPQNPLNETSFNPQNPSPSSPKPNTGSVLDVSFASPSTGSIIQPQEKKEKKRFRSNGISKQHIALINSKMGKSLETVDNTLPPGSFVQGVLLSGVDASTSTSASANPEPVLIELTDSGDLSRFFTSTVKGCRVTASCYGVLSKERVMMRLEKLSCIEAATGEVMTTDVEGYVSGEDGKLGLRGVVVDRAGDHVRAAMIGGFLSSFGNFLASVSNPVTFSAQTGLAQITPPQGGDLLKNSAAKGASSALDKYTEFYIKRAEQLEPVIQVGAGRVVQVVFNKSVGIGKSEYKQTVSVKNDKARTQTLEHVRTQENTSFSH